MLKAYAEKRKRVIIEIYHTLLDFTFIKGN